MKRREYGGEYGGGGMYMDISWEEVMAADGKGGRRDAASRRGGCVTGRVCAHERVSNVWPAVYVYNT